MTAALYWLADLAEAFAIALSRAADRRMRRRLLRRRNKAHRKDWA